MRTLTVYVLLAIFTLQSSIVAAMAISENLMPSQTKVETAPYQQVIIQHQHEHNHQHDENDHHDAQHHCHGHFHFMAALLPEVLSFSTSTNNPLYENEHDDLFSQYLSSPQRPPIYA